MVGPRSAMPFGHPAPSIAGASLRCYPCSNTTRVI